MDASCKKAFIIIFGTPTLLSLVAGWILLGDQTIRSGLFYGLFDNISLMWIPTILTFIVAGFVDRFIFGGSLLNCIEKKINKKTG